MRYINKYANYEFSVDQDGNEEFILESYEGYKAAPLAKGKYTYADIRFRYNGYSTTDNWLYGDEQNRNFTDLTFGNFETFDVDEDEDLKIRA